MKTLIKQLVLVGLSLYAFNGWTTPVNINTADAKTLSDALTGIGMKKAEAIVKYREEKGLFKTAENLKDVPGIGEKTFEKNKADILLDSAKEAMPSAADAPKKDKK
jgi:competence protein ComEA